MVIVVVCLLCLLTTMTFSTPILCPEKTKWNYPVFWIGLTGEYPCEYFTANGRSTTANTVLNCPYTSSAVSESLNVNAYGASQYSLDSTTRAPSSTGKSFSGCLVQSDNPISAVVINKASGQIGGTQFRELKQLGQEYYIMTASQQISIKHEFVIMAAFADTHVSVRFPPIGIFFVIYNGIGYIAGKWINDTLRDFQTMKIESSTGDLTGSYVVSDKPISVVAGNFETNVKINETTVFGHVEESMPPVQDLGKYYIAAPLINGHYTCTLRILAVRDVTTVRIGNRTNPDVISVVISFNEVYDFDFNCEIHFITSDEDIMVGLFTQTGGTVGGHPAFFVLTSLENPGTEAWFSVPDNYGFNLTTAFELNYVNIIVKTVDADGIRVNNSGITHHFHQNITIGNDSYSAYSVPVDATSSGSYRISGGFFTGYFEARKDDWRSYGYTLIPYQGGSEFLFWDENVTVTAENITYNSGFDVKNYEMVSTNRTVKSFDPSTDLVLNNTNKFVALNKCKKTSCDMVSCSKRTCTLSYTPLHCIVYRQQGSVYYKYSGEKEETCSPQPPPQ